MGLEPKPDVRDYWRKIDGNEFIKNTKLPRDDFLAIWQSLWHLSDDCLFKIEEMLNAQAIKIWNPFQRVAVDEMIARFKGRSKHKVYAPDKPTKWGLKFYCGKCYWNFTEISRSWSI